MILADEKEYGMFEGSPFSEERYKLDAHIIISKAKTDVYPGIEIKEINGVEEHRPIFPNFAIVDQAVGNLKEKLKFNS
jgi:hypothetical protein